MATGRSRGAAFSAQLIDAGLVAACVAVTRNGGAGGEIDEEYEEKEGEKGGSVVHGESKSARGVQLGGRASKSSGTRSGTARTARSQGGGYGLKERRASPQAAIGDSQPL